MIRAAAIFFAVLLLASCLSKPDQLTRKVGPKRLALAGSPFLTEERDGTRIQLFYGGRNASEVVIILSEKAGNAISPSRKQYQFDLSESDVVTVDRYRLQIIKAEEADMMFRVVLN